jgi:hypothetical protein
LNESDQKLTIFRVVLVIAGLVHVAIRVILARLAALNITPPVTAEVFQATVGVVGIATLGSPISGCLSSKGLVGAIVRCIVGIVHNVRGLCSNTLSFMIYLAASSRLATDAESATLAERAMRASRKKGDISGAAGDGAEDSARLSPFYTI